MATFGGENIFGLLKEMHTSKNTRAFQANTYPAQNGVEELDQGARGHVTECRGTLRGSGPYGLAALENVWFDYIDGQYYTLMDQLGTSWAYVTLESFKTEGRAMTDTYGYYYRSYAAGFRHLI